MDEATHMRMLLYRRARSIIHNARRLDGMSVSNPMNMVYILLVTNQFFRAIYGRRSMSRC